MEKKLYNFDDLLFYYKDTDIRTQLIAIRMTDNFKKVEHESLLTILTDSFIWNKTEEGGDYWWKIYYKLKQALDV